jgi:hypothetical protein
MWTLPATGDTSGVTARFRPRGPEYTLDEAVPAGGEQAVPVGGAGHGTGTAPSSPALRVAGSSHDVGYFRVGPGREFDTLS